jgi:hypothetical protein
MRRFRIPLPASWQGMSISEASREVMFKPFLDGTVNFSFIVVRQTVVLPHRGRLQALVEFERDLELDERVLLRLKYDAEEFEFETFSSMRLFNIAADEIPKVEQKND